MRHPPLPKPPYQPQAGLIGIYIYIRSHFGSSPTGILWRWLGFAGWAFARALVLCALAFLLRLAHTIHGLLGVLDHGVLGWWSRHSPSPFVRLSFFACAPACLSHLCRLLSYNYILWVWRLLCGAAGIANFAILPSKEIVASVGGPIYPT